MFFSFTSFIVNLPNGIPALESFTVPVTNIRASSYEDKYPPSRSRLNTLPQIHPELGGGWCAAEQNMEQWIEIDLNKTRTVTGIVVQGDAKRDFWVTKYSIQHSINGVNYTDYVIGTEDVSK